MRTKLIGVMVCTLIILATTLSVAGNIGNERIKIVNNQTVFSEVTPPEVWNETYGGDYYDSGFSVQETSDGGYIICGTTIPIGETYSDVYLVKTDADGNVDWEQNHGEEHAEYGYSVQETSDGGFIVGGYIYNYGNNMGDVYLLKTNAIGDFVWSVIIGGDEIDEAFSVQQTGDGGYIVVGYTESDTTSRDVYFVKTDSIGKPVWEKTFGGSGSNIGYCVKETSDFGYIIAGSTDSTGSNRDVWLIKTDGDGTEEWNRKFGGVEGDWANSVQETSDGFVITGTTLSYGAGGQDVWLIKTNDLGVKEWDKTFGGAGSDSGEEVQETSDGSIIIAGHTTSYGAGSEDAYLIKTDSTGNVLWTKTMGGAQGDQGHSVYQTSGDDFIVAGETLSYGSASSYDVWLVKVRWGNNPPNKPAKPDGPAGVPLGRRRDYKASAVDPDGDQVYLMFDWGDGQFSDWLGPVDSGQTVTEDHWWVNKGSYLVKTKAKDVLGEESIWSDPLTVTMSKNKVINLQFMNWLENHPNLFPFLRCLLGL
jgi:hypothetical protein